MTFSFSELARESSTPRRMPWWGTPKLLKAPYNVCNSESAIPHQMALTDTLSVLGRPCAPESQEYGLLCIQNKNWGPTRRLVLYLYLTKGNSYKPHISIYNICLSHPVTCSLYLDCHSHNPLSISNFTFQGPGHGLFCLGGLWHLQVKLIASSSRFSKDFTILL